MNAERYERPYLDSSVFIAWLKGETELGAFRICISALTLAEVHKKRGHERLTDDERTEIIQFFEHDYIDVVSVDRMIGEQAHRFCREYGLSPADAIHLACALRASCDCLLSWDDALNDVDHPHIRYEEPRIFGQLEFGLEAEGEDEAPGLE